MKQSSGERNKWTWLDSLTDSIGKNMTVEELAERYLSTKTGVKKNTLENYKFVWKYGEVRHESKDTPAFDRA